MDDELQISRLGLGKRCSHCRSQVPVASTRCEQCGRDVGEGSWVFASLGIPLNIAAKRSVFASAAEKAAERAQAVVSREVGRAAGLGWQVAETSDFLDLHARGHVASEASSGGGTTFTRVTVLLKQAAVDDDLDGLGDDFSFHDGAAAQTMDPNFRVLGRFRMIGGHGHSVPIRTRCSLACTSDGILIRTEWQPIQQ